MNETLLSLNRMARRLGVTSQWLRRESETGRVPCLRADRKFLYAPAAVEKALAERAAAGLGGTVQGPLPATPTEVERS